MIYKIFILIFIALMFLPIGLCEKFEDIKELNNTKVYNENDKIISIYNKNIDKSMDIKLISTISDIDKLIKIIEITNYIEYRPNKKNDFITKTKKVYGKNNIYKIEYFIEKYNYTFKNIIINKTIFNNKTGKNESKLINKSVIKNIKSFWIEFKPYNKTIFRNETFKLKIIHYKKPELGFFKIQTIPIFKNIKCKEFTWWNGNWNLKRPILINNVNGDNVTNYQLKSVNLSQYQINASSARIINESSGLLQNHWNKSIDNNGNLEYVWCNFTNILNNTWVNNTYYIYYQSNSIVNSYSNGENTFIFFDDFLGDSLNTSKWDSSGSGSVSISNSIIDFAPYYDIQSKIAYGNNNILEYYAKHVNDRATSGFCTEGGETDYYWNAFFIDDGTVRYITAGDDLSVTYNTNPNIDFLNIWRNFKIVKSNINIKSYIDNTLELTSIKGIDILREIRFSTDTLSATSNGDLKINWIFLRKYTINEPELWTVGNIEYPEDLDMNCSLKIITHLTNKNIKIVDMNGSIIKENSTNECINLSYDSYVIYMSNPVKISSFTELLNTIDNVFIQLFLFAFLIVIGIIFYTFLQIIKNKGFKGVTK